MGTKRKAKKRLTHRRGKRHRGRGEEERRKEDKKTRKNPICLRQAGAEKAKECREAAVPMTATRTIKKGPHRWWPGR
jgi:hypothetical protein